MPTSSLLSINPNNGEILRTYAAHSLKQVDEALGMVAQAGRSWRKSSLESRAALLSRLAAVLRRRREEWAELIHQEMGKSMSEALAELEKCASCAEYYANHGPSFLRERPVSTEAARSFVAFEPLGTVLAIMPWNFPFWQAFRCAIPAILAGNTVVLKHASNVSGSALAIEQAWSEAFGGPGLLRTLLLTGKDALGLLAREEISAVSFTGSTEVGRKIAAAAGAQLKKSVLELGGSDAYVILEDANLELAASVCARSRLLNSGQSCISAKRFIVVQSVQKEFEQRFVAKLKEAAVAPLAREDLRQELQQQVSRSIAQGAKVLCGGSVPEGPGWHYPPTAIGGVKPGMALFDEETFGPVAALVEADSEEEAVRLANLSSFGLGAAIFTGDWEKGMGLAKDALEAGSCFVNEQVRSDPRLPFGGIKNSGYGRELGELGLLEFVNVKTIYGNPS